MLPINIHMYGYLYVLFILNQVLIVKDTFPTFAAKGKFPCFSVQRYVPSFGWPKVHFDL